MQIFTGLLSPGFISSCKSWIRNIKPAQRISIIWSDDADPAEVLLFRRKPAWDQAFPDTGREERQGPGLEATSCCRALMSLYAFHMLRCRRKRRDDATQICRSSASGCFLMFECGARSLPRRPPAALLRDVSEARRQKMNSSSLIKPT